MVYGQQIATLFEALPSLHRNGHRHRLHRNEINLQDELLSQVEFITDLLHRVNNSSIAMQNAHPTRIEPDTYIGNCIHLLTLSLQAKVRAIRTTEMYKVKTIRDPSGESVRGVLICKNSTHRC